MNDNSPESEARSKTCKNSGEAPCYLWIDFEKQQPSSERPVLALLSTGQYEVAYIKKLGNYNMWISCSDHLPFGYAEKSSWMDLPPR